MAKNFAYLQLFLMVVSVTGIVCLPNYWDERENILKAEDSVNLGSHLPFEIGERIVNDILRTAKEEEFAKGRSNASAFAPGKNFLDAKKDIEQSEVFRMIQKIPKGAVLHAHDTAIVSEEFIFDNITYRDNLYACEAGAKKGDKLALRFFATPNDECDWKLLSVLRRDPEYEKSIDERIHRQLSMYDEKTSKTGYENGDLAWNKFMSIFQFITPFLTYKPVYEDHFYQGLQELYDDNVMYMELRSTLPTIYELNGTEYGPVDVARIYKSTTDRFVKDHPKFIGVKLIYAPIKTADPVEFEKFLRVAAELKHALPDFVAGFDLVGQEDIARPLSDWVNRLIDTIAGNVPFFFHAGETNWSGLGPDSNLIDAVLLNSKRIGHGYALTKHPEVLELVKKRGIAIEICPISNQVLALVKDMRNHPANSLFIDGVPVVISNDDPGLWGAKALSYDFYEAFMGMMPYRADLRAIKQLAINSLKYSTLNDTEKDRAMSLWHDQWNSFLDYYAPSSSIQSTIMK